MAHGAGCGRECRCPPSLEGELVWMTDHMYPVHVTLNHDVWSKGYLIIVP